MNELRPLACLVRYGYHHVKWGKGQRWSKLVCFRCGESQGNAYREGKLLVEYMDDDDMVPVPFEAKGASQDFIPCATLKAALQHLGVSHE